CAVFFWFLVPVQSTGKKLLAILAAMVLGVALVAATPLSERFARTMNVFSNAQINYSGTNGARLAMWHCGWTNALKTPLVGPGHDAALRDMRTCAAETFNAKLKFSHFHNFYLDQFAKGGVIALLAAVLLSTLPLSLLIVWWRRGLLRAKEGLALKPGVQTVLAAAVAVFFSIQFIAGMFNIGLGHDILDAGFIYTFVLLFGAIYACSGRREFVDRDSSVAPR
ncbi:MAG: O-antigen ligase family protein, partial [Pseudomonadota bacterium]